MGAIAVERAAGEKPAAELNIQEELRLARRAEMGDFEARDALVVHALPMVKFVARQHLANAPLLELGDLVNAGVLGLMAAVNEFRPDRGARFKTYAQKWVRGEIRRAIARSEGGILIPPHRRPTQRKIWEYAEAHLESTGRRPSIAEIAAAIDESTETVHRLVTSRAEISLDAPAGEGDDESFTWAEVVRIDTGIGHDRFAHAELVTLLEVAVCGLSAEEIDVVKDRFVDDQTVPQIAQKRGCTINQVLVIERRAIRKLRSGIGASRDDVLAA